MNKFELTQILESHQARFKFHTVPETVGTSVVEHVKHLGISFADACATLVFATDHGFVALMRRDDCRIDNKKFKSILSTKNLRIATTEELKRETGYDVGLVSPLKLNIPIFVDTKVLERKNVFVGSGDRTYTLEINVQDLLKIAAAKQVDVCEIDSSKTGESRERILTGDRPTGPLHIGHFVGSLQNRVKLQDQFETFILIADAQALTDNYEHPEKVRQNVLEIYKDYLAVGIDPQKSKIFVQSMIPQIAELTVLFMNLVSHNEVLRNPTVKTEIAQKGFADRVPFGFVGYPVSQAADILIVKGNLVPVGEDQLPMIEISQKIAKRFNDLYGSVIFPEPKAQLSEVKRLPGTDGNSKMSKSIGNVINLKDSEQDLRKKIMGMYTDPNRIHATDPGRVEGNPVFIYHDAFNPNLAEVTDLKERYTQGKVGDVEVKEKLFIAMNNLLGPIREKRAQLDNSDQASLLAQLKDSTTDVEKISQQTMAEVKKAMQINYF